MGIIGFKPSHGWLPTDGVIPYAPSLDTIGLHARSVNDIVAAYNALADPHMSHVHGGPIGPPRLAIWADALAHANERMRAGVIDAIEAIANEGATIADTVAPFSFDNLLAIHTIISRAEGAASHSELIATHAAHYAPRVRSMVETGMALPADVYIRANYLRDQARREIAGIWSPFDAIIIPTSESAAPDLSTTGSHNLQAAATLLGLPSITLPIGFNADYLPIGFQLIGTAPGSDAHLLRTAAWVAQHMPQMPRPNHGVQAP